MTQVAPKRSSSGSRAPDSSRRVRKKARTRREIFRAAMELFAERGFQPVTIEQICSAADVARATFFLHFPSKSALLFALNRELADELAQLLVEPRGSALSECRLVLEHLGDRWLRYADAMGAMLREFLVTPGTDAPAERRARELLDLIEGVVRRGQERGEFRRNISARLAATMFLQTAAAILSGGIYRDAAATPEQVRNEFLHALLHGLAEPKPRLKWSPKRSPASG